MALEAASHHLAPDAAQIAAFVDAMFRYAEGPIVSLRAFGDGADKTRAIPVVRAFDLVGGDMQSLTAAAASMARDVAERTQAYVFCPPVATFRDARKADEAHLAEGLCVSVELDADPAEGLARLEPALGPATVVVESGGITADGEPKLHAYWRLSEVATGPADHATLKAARAHATALAGGDVTNVSTVHPIRWPGSVHRKSAPRLATIVALRPEREIHLAEALDALAEASAAQGVSFARAAPSGVLREIHDDGARLRAIASGATYHEHLRFFAASLIRAGLPRWRAQRLLDGVMDLVDEPRRDERWTARKAAIPGLIHSAEGKFAPPAARSLIRLVAGRHAESVDAAVSAIAAAPQAEIYVSGRALVRLLPGDAGLDRPARLEPMPLIKASARDALGRLCRFETLRKLKDDEVWVETDCPDKVAEAVLARGAWPGLRVLRGLAHAPLLRADGSILQSEGYDAASGLYLDFRGARFSPIPERPTRADALVALDRLKRPIRAYRWAGTTRDANGQDIETEEARQNRAAVLALLLTAALRRSLDRAPGFLIDATAPGAGKGKLVDVAAIIATGAVAEVVTMKEAKEETPKVIDAALLSGASHLALDDVEPHHLTCAALRALLTAEVARVRPMGGSEFRAAQANLLVTATGNGIALAKDMVRRFVIARIDPGVEAPEDRGFSFDPVAEARVGRADLLVACLTIGRAFVVAGRPPQNGALMGSFEGWCASVRDPLLWLGEADPVATTHRMRADDPAREALSALMHAWGASFGARAVTAATVLRDARGDLRDALDMLGLAKDSRGFGEWLRRHKGRRVGGMMFVSEGVTNGSARWRLDGWRGGGGEGQGGEGG
jgi:hypothetical protein